MIYSADDCRANWQYPDYTPGKSVQVLKGKHKDKEGVIHIQHDHNGGEYVTIKLPGVHDNPKLHCKNLKLI